MNLQKSVKNGLAGTALLSLVLVGTAPAAQAALPEYCSPSIGCTGKDENGENIYADGEFPTPEEHAATVQCFGGVFAGGAGTAAAKSVLAATGALAGGTATAAGPCSKIF